MKVLVVEDRPDNAYLLIQLLKTRGFEVEQASNGVEALKKLQSEKFDLIISDLMMPEMDGFMFCHLVKSNEQLTQIPFVVYTATYTDLKDEELARSLGADAFIVKPTEPDEFLRIISEIHFPAAPPKPQESFKPPEETVFLRQYNERLVHKLEDKIFETEKKNTELQELTQTLEQRIQGAVKDLEERNQALETFSSSVSHDLRSPLRAISGMAMILKEEIGNSLAPEHQAYLERIIKGASQMNRMIEGFLAYSRMSTGKIPLQPVALELVTHSAINQVSPRLEETKGRIHLQKPLPMVRAYEPVLVQVLVNLFDNAIKFVEKGTHPMIHISAEERDGRVQLMIRDNGIGIEPQYRDRIFEVFERLHSSESYSGHGMGLSIARKGIERMGGTIRVEGSPGGGSCFVINLAKG